MNRLSRALTHVRLTPARRRWLYTVGLTLTPLVVFYGIATDEEAALWFALFSASLNGVALANVPDVDPPD